MLAHHSHNRGNEAIGRVGDTANGRVDAVDLVDLVDDPPLIQTTSTPSTRPFAVSPHRRIAHALSLTSHLAIATNSPTVHQFITKNVL